MDRPAFWGKARGHWAAYALSPVSWLWSGGGYLRRLGVRPWRASVPVICVGNVVVGGAGKTPLVRRLACDLTSAGETPHILTRGYGGVAKGPLRVEPESHSSYHVGDEALELAEVAPVWVGRRREQTARAAQQDGASVLLMDDGLQYPGLHKDFSFLVIDRQGGLGNGRIMPAGPLREGFCAALKRTHAVVLMGVLGGAERPLPAFDVPCLRADMICPPRAGAVVAFAGIASGDKFVQALRASGVQVLACEDFGDHHVYTQRDMEALLALAAYHEAPLVTTAKDAARLRGRTEPWSRALMEAVEVIAAEVVFEDEDAWRVLVRSQLLCM